MRRWILVSVACFALGMHVAYTFSDKLMANDEPIGNPATAATPQNSSVTAPIPQQVPSVLGDPNAPPIEFQAPHYPTPTPRYANQPAYVSPNEMEISTGWSSPPGSPKLGTFTIVSDGKCSVLLNTSTGDSWTLVIDGQGSHWESIAIGVPAQQGQQGGADSSLTLSERHQAARDARDKSVEANDLGLEDSATIQKQERQIRRLSDRLRDFAQQLDVAKRRNELLEKATEERISEQGNVIELLKKQNNELIQKNDELAKQLKDAQLASGATPNAAPEPDDGPFEEK